MAAEIKKEIQLEIAHVLFNDIVGYSKLSINEQRAAIDELTQAVRASEQFQNAEAAARLIKIPTGDGMALVFYKSQEEPVECALEISRALKEHPKLQLRMGVHSGPVSGVIDVNGQANLAGAGLNMAQRVMDCGDAGHILLSKRVQDEILTDLAKIADLKVISRASVMQYRDAAGRNLRQIGQQLGVAHVLEGTVQRAADKVRVNTQLINARTDAHEWAENYDRPLNDVFAIQSEIAKAIADQLQARLSPSEKAAIEQAPTNDIVANDLYVRARALRDLADEPGGKGSLLQAVSLLEEPVRHVPKFLLAYRPLS